ncbi:MAG: hypothetical protein HRU20_20540 [Pseudomonadales bacterium]|nr:hypothetical protein [Pseudomonadales bacterium]
MAVSRLISGLGRTGSSSLLLIIGLACAQHLQALPTLRCDLDNLASLIEEQGCLLPAPTAVAAADIGIKIFLPPAAAENISHQQVTALLAKTIVFIDGYASGLFTYPDQAHGMMGLNKQAVIISVITGPAQDDTVQDYSLQIQRLLEALNRHRAAIKKPSPMVLVGFSLGGVAARHALTSMEKVAVKHHVGLYISYDAPHAGVHVPQSLQFIVPILDQYVDEIEPWSRGISLAFALPMREVKKTFNDARTALQSFNNTAYNSAVYRQLLLNNINTDGQPFTDFYNQMQALGYPQHSRNIAVANGSTAVAQFSPAFDNDDADNVVAHFSARSAEKNYVQADLTLYKSQAGKTAIAMNVNISGSKIGARPCFLVFNCSYNIAIGADLPQQRKAAATVLALDDMPGASMSLIGQVVHGMTQGVENFYSVTSPYYDATVEPQLLPLVDDVNKLKNTNPTPANTIKWSFIPTGSAIGLAINSDAAAIRAAVLEPQHFQRIIINGDAPAKAAVNYAHDDFSHFPLLEQEISQILFID